MYECEEVGEAFMESARARGRGERVMNVNASQVYAALEDGPSWTRWVAVITNVEWTSPKPYGVGTTRTVTLVAGVKIEEVFWGWEEDRHVAFRVTRGSSRMLAALAESYRITPIDDHSCKVEWRMAMKLNGPLRFVEKYMRGSLGPVLTKLLGALEKEATRFPAAVRAKSA